MNRWEEEIERRLITYACSQCVTVRTDGSRADIRLYERHRGRWRERRRCRARGICGRGGVTDRKREGDGCTPRGCFAIGNAFYTESKPRTKLRTFAVMTDTCWVDDPTSPLYNRCVHASLLQGAHAEYMSQYAEYACGFVIDHNALCEAGRGSAVFFHVALPTATSTAGCIAADETVVRRYLRRLNASRCPYILIE